MFRGDNILTKLYNPRTALNMNKRLPLTFSSLMMLTIGCAVVSGQTAQPAQSRAAIPAATLLTIIRHEDERRWDDQLKELLTNSDPKIRARAALAAGRIGDETAVPVLTESLMQDKDQAVREMVAFALGEIEAPGGAYALVTVLKNTENPARARAIEALGKITAAMMASTPAAANKPDDRLDQCKAAIVEALRFELQRKPNRDRLTALLGLTAVLRVRPDGAGSLVTKFLDDTDPAIIATALNTMARLRVKEGNERVRQLLNHNDPVVRANAARVIAGAEHKEAFDAVLDRALHDSDLRVRVSAIRALASLKDPRAVDPLLNGTISAGINEQLEIATVLGRLLPNTANEKAVAWLRALHDATKGEAVEVEVALARVAPAVFLSDLKLPANGAGTTWRQLSRRAQGLAAIKEVISAPASGSAGDKALKDAQKELADMLQRPNLPTLATSDVLEAYAGYKPADVDQYARRFLQSKDPVVRSSAAEVLGNLTPGEANARALIEVLPRALRESVSDDVASTILGALAKQKTAAANDAIKTALDSPNQLVRRRAVALLKTNGVGDFADRIGTVQTKNRLLDYRRAMARIGRQVTATVVTNRGSFTIQFLPEDAPLTIDNFVQLARRGYFNGQTIPRVVPNFVVQAGDPRGDQNGGPGYEIRCEINQMLFERAVVGMALSGKDTGGSQWFVTHSPQPHLDGGYTVFGRVTRGMDVVDNIIRGDVIRRVIVNER